MNIYLKTRRPVSPRMKAVFSLLFLLHFITQGEGMKPRIVEDIKNITVEVGRDVTFTCTVSDIHGYRIGWVKANTKAIQAIGNIVITHNTRLKVSHDESRRRWNLHIESAQLEDTGPYMCQINTDPMQSKMGYLDVVITPDIVDIRGPSVVVEGGSAKLECEARGEPAPLVFWQRENSREKITVINKRDGTKEKHVRLEGKLLQLNKISRDQAGGYLCIASNGHPPAVSRRIQLDVKFRPIVTVPMQHVQGVLGRTATLQCEVDAFPRPEVTWAKKINPFDNIVTGGRYIKEDFHLSDYKTRTVLSIYNYTSKDEGLYDCRAMNEMNLKGDTVDGGIYLNTDKGSQEDATESIWTTDPYLILTDYDFSQVPYNSPPVPAININTHNTKTPGMKRKSTSRPAKHAPPTPQRFLNSAISIQSCVQISTVYLLPFLLLCSPLHGAF